MVFGEAGGGGKKAEDRGAGGWDGPSARRDGSPPEWEPRLYLPAGRDGRGFLIFSPSPKETTLIELTPSLIRPILALQEGRQATRHLPLPARGWMSASKLAEAIAGRDDHLLETEEQTVRAYISKINKEIRRAAARSGREGPVLIEHRRLLGFRLATDRLVVIDGTNAGQAGKQPPRGRPKPKLP